MIQLVHDKEVISSTYMQRTPRTSCDMPAATSQARRQKYIFRVNTLLFIANPAIFELPSRHDAGLRVNPPAAVISKSPPITPPCSREAGKLYAIRGQAQR